MDLHKFNIYTPFGRCYWNCNLASIQIEEHMGCNQFCNYYVLLHYYSLEASRGAGAQNVTVKLTGCGFSRKWNSYLHKYFHFFALVSRQSAALSSATQHAMPPEFSRKWRHSVLALGSLCLPCCVRNTAWIVIDWLIDSLELVNIARPETSGK